MSDEAVALGGATLFVMDPVSAWRTLELRCVVAFG
jgi:hypothetical protein